MKHIVPAVLLLACATHAALVPAGLRCEYRVNPLGIDAKRPRLSWVLESSERGQKQTAYQVLVASSLAALARGEGDLWNSGKVGSPRASQVEYAGKPLASYERCFWKVRVWDRQGKPGAWTQPAEWSMGILQPSDWTAAWISLPKEAQSVGALPVFRREFSVDKRVRRAVVYASGVGFFELYLNGRKVGDQVLSPLWTNYRKTVNYLAFDITRDLKPGANTFGAALGNGFYNVTGGRYIKYKGSFGDPAFLLQARVEYEDGTVEHVVTDARWKAAPGPVTFSCIFGGEDYDARREHPGWMLPGFDDSAWRAAATGANPGGELVAESAPPVKVMESFRTVRVTEPAPGIRVYDLGQNFAGWPRIRVRGKAGASVKMSTAELLGPDGKIDPTSAMGAWKGPGISFNYTLKGGGVEEWHPRFSYTGFRYVQVETDAEVLSLEGDFVHSSAERTGSFTSSNTLFNRVEKLVDYAVRSNFQSVLTDCPHREKLGWLEQSYLMGPSILYRFDGASFYAKIARDTREAQLDNGLVPDIAPEYTVFRGGFRDSPEWGSAAVEVPWLAYLWYGDTRVLSESYRTMVGYVDYLESQAKDGIVSQGLGDWYDIGPGGLGPSKLTPMGVTSTAAWYHDLKILEQAATVLGKPEDARSFAARAARVREDFNRRFFDAANGRYATGSQTAQAMPLVYGMVPEGQRDRVLASLVADVRNRGNKQTAGDIGYHFLIAALTAAGRSDVLYDMNVRSDNPSYGYQLSKGVTSLAEDWAANPHSSQNHFMLGHVQEWFITGLAGINQAEGSTGFERLVLRPAPAGELTSVSAHFDSIRGRIESRWTRENGTFRWRVRIPAGATATVFVPAASAGAVKEGAVPAAKAAGLKLVREEPGYAVFEAVSGVYSFAAPIPGR
jgi:hypothetical protein